MSAPPSASQRMASARLEECGWWSLLPFASTWRSWCECVLGGLPSVLSAPTARLAFVSPRGHRAGQGSGAGQPVLIVILSFLPGLAAMPWGIPQPWRWPTGCPST